MTTGAPARPLLARERSVLVPCRLLLGLQRRVWQLAFVPGDRAARLRARLPPVSHSLLPTPPASKELRSGAQGTGTHDCHSQEAVGSFSTYGFTEELTDELLWPTSACPAVALDYCTRGLAAQVPVPHTQVTSPFVTPVCAGGHIPAPGEGSFAQLMPVTSILCWLMQGGAGKPAASPGAWKRPRC